MKKPWLMKVTVKVLPSYGPIALRIAHRRTLVFCVCSSTFVLTAGICRYQGWPEGYAHGLDRCGTGNRQLQQLMRNLCSVQGGNAVCCSLSSKNTEAAE